MIKIFLMFLPYFLYPPEQGELTDRMAPPGYQGNFWGPEATKARREGKMPPLAINSRMAKWDRWGRKVLRDGDIVFRLGDARILHGFFPMSRFYSNCSNSKFSHTGIVAIEDNELVVYDTTGTGVARQPFCVWILDNVGCIGVKRLRKDLRQAAVPKVLAYCRKVFVEQPPFDYELGLDDTELYCVEMTEKAYRYAGLPLSQPVKIGDMERAPEYPLCMLGIGLCSKCVLKHPLTAETPVYFPGNERHGIWSCPKLVMVVPPTFQPGNTDLPDEGLPLVADNQK